MLAGVTDTAYFWGSIAAAAVAVLTYLGITPRAGYDTLVESVKRDLGQSNGKGSAIEMLERIDDRVVEIGTKLDRHLGWHEGIKEAARS